METERNRRARFGSTRNPIWRHGGIAGGRTGEENFTKKLSKNAKRVAVMQALSMKNTAKAIHVIDTLGIKDGKVKEVVKTLMIRRLLQRMFSSLFQKRIH